MKKYCERSILEIYLNGMLNITERIIQNRATINNESQIQTG